MERSEIYAQIKREMEKYRDYAINKADEEIKIIYKKYPRLKEIDKELEIMCNLSQAIEMDIKEKTVRKVTREVTRQNNVRAIYNVMKNLNVSFDVAIDILGFTKNEKIILKEYLKNKEYLLTL